MYIVSEVRDIGKQDMSDKYASDYAETFDMTEEEARKQWDYEVFSHLTSLITMITESTSTVFPLTCPKCNSFKMTVVFGTGRSLECLSCRSKFRVEDK